VTDQTAGRLVSILRERPRLKTSLKRALNAIGYDTTDWVRVVMYQRAFAFIEQLGPQSLDVLEISGGPQWHERFSFRSYLRTGYPGFDICNDTLARRFDLIIADQVFEHVERPTRAAANVYAMLRPGGHFIIATPFLIRIHGSPIDCSRWTPEGLVHLLGEGGFPKDRIHANAWGNRACLKANLSHWRKRGFFGSLRNEPAFPVMVWAFATKPQETQEV
jgi:SAM-dependent methyltransferase